MIRAKKLLIFEQNRFALIIRAKLINLHKIGKNFVFPIKLLFFHLLLFLFFGLSFVHNVFDFALLYVFTESLTRPGNFECITRFVELKT